MRNLRVNSVKRSRLKTSSGKISGIVIVDEDDFYYIKDGEFCSMRNNVEIVLCPESMFETIPGGEPEYLAFENRIWFATRDRMVYYCRDTEQVSSVFFDKSVSCAAWNPTREVLAVVHEDDAQVVVYTIDLENECTQCMDCTSLSVSVPRGVYVGWGSADTQFRGSEGKLKKPPLQQNKIQPVVVVFDRIPRITWRGNGEMFAVNYYCNETNCRTFKVYQQDCTPLYECAANVLGLQSVIAWRPEGNMIANSIRREDGTYGVFIFEKNGYKRFEFSLVYDRCEVKQLKWSGRGEVLAVFQENTEQQRYLSLYTTSNYKWYLKQHLVFDDTPLISFCWQSVLGPLFNLQVITETADVFTYEYQMGFDVSEDDDCCAVIDGKQLHLTRFQDACLPPPMSQTTISVQDAINFVVFYSNKSQQIAVIDCKWQVTVFNYENNIVITLFSYKIQHGNNVFYNFHGLKENVLHCLTVSSTAACDVSLVSIAHNDGGKVLCERVLDKKNPKRFQSFKNGRLYQIDDEIFVEIENKKTTFSLPSSQSHYLIETVYCQIENEPYLFSLNATNHFSINDTCVLNNVSSFVVFNKTYLLLTVTNNHLLYCIRLLRSEIEKLRAVNGNHDFLQTMFFHRPIEHGGNVICGVNGTGYVILQIPRGNLEIVSCRLIAIDILENFLNDGNWREALHFLRTDRLNFNLLIDLGVDRFLKNIEKFVEACETPLVLNSFIQEIEDANVLETIYLQCCKRDCANDAKRNKRQVICDALLSYFEKVDYANYAVPIVTIALNHFNVEMALTYIQDLLRYLPETEHATANAMKTIIVHTRAGEGDEFLLKKSLQLYDTHLTRYVCSFTQIDPKTYLPFLNELDTYSELKRRYMINVYLNRPLLAVQYLIRDVDVDSCNVLRRYIENHPDVLPIVYDYYDKDASMFNEISKLYGEFLSKRKLHAEAAIVFSLAELWRETFEQYKLANDWQAALAILNSKFECSDVMERHTKIIGIVDDLIRARRYKDAAQIQEEHLNNYEDAINTLLNGYHFRDALFICFKQKRTDMISHDVVPAIQKYCVDLEEKLSGNRKTFYEYKERLLKLRTAKLQKYKTAAAASILIDVEMDGVGDVDLYSDAGTTITKTTTRSFKSSSSRSQSSTRSSRNKRKEERKKQDLREGGIYEDIALIRALYILIEDTFRMGTDMRELCLVLQTLDMRKEGKYLQNLLKQLQREMLDDGKLIWPETIVDPTTIEHRIIYENFNAIDEKYKSPPSSLINDNGISWQLTLFNECNYYTESFENNKVC